MGTRDAGGPEQYKQHGQPGFERLEYSIERFQFFKHIRRRLRAVLYVWLSIHVRDKLGNAVEHIRRPVLDGRDGPVVDDGPVQPGRKRLPGGTEQPR